LGSGKPDSISLLPRLVDDLSQLRVVDIEAGDSHCLALTHDNEASFNMNILNIFQFQKI
jgi:E3 ubiquitin-protein ligase HERC1